MPGRFVVRARFGFEAAHHLDIFAEDRGRSALHGHSYEAVVGLAAPEGETGDVVEDLYALEDRLKALAGRLDHTLLNDLPGLEHPTLENIARFIAREGSFGPRLAFVEVSRPSLGHAVRYEPETGT